MINIVRGQSNTVVVTLTEKTTIDLDIAGSGYVFEFTNPMTHEVFVFTATDISTAKGRFNQFTVTEDDTADLENGIVTMQPTGTWLYRAYETEDVAQAITDQSVSGLSEVENGIVLVTETETPKDVYDPAITNIPVYNP